MVAMNATICLRGHILTSKNTALHRRILPSGTESIVRRCQDCERERKTKKEAT